MCPKTSSRCGGKQQAKTTIGAGKADIRRTESVAKSCRDGFATQASNGRERHRNRKEKKLLSPDILLRFLRLFAANLPAADDGGLMV